MKLFKFLSLLSILIVFNSCENEFKEFTPCSTINESNSITLLDEELYTFPIDNDTYDDTDYWPPIIIGDELIYQEKIGYKSVNLIKKNLKTGGIIHTINTIGILNSNAKRYDNNLIFLEDDNSVDKKITRVNLENFEVSELSQYENFNPNISHFSMSSGNYFVRLNGYLDSGLNLITLFELTDIATFQKVKTLDVNHSVELTGAQKITTFDYYQDPTTQINYLILGIPSLGGSGVIKVYDMDNSQLVNTIDNHMAEVYNTVMVDNKIFFYFRKLQESPSTGIFSTLGYNIQALDIPSGTILWETEMEERMAPNDQETIYNDADKSIIFYTNIEYANDHDYYHFNINDGNLNKTYRPSIQYNYHSYVTLYEGDLFYSSNEIARYDLDLECNISKSEPGLYRSFLIDNDTIYSYYNFGFRTFKIDE